MANIKQLPFGTQTIPFLMNANSLRVFEKLTGGNILTGDVTINFDGVVKLIYAGWVEAGIEAREPVNIDERSITITLSENFHQAAAFIDEFKECVTTIVEKAKATKN